MKKKLLISLAIILASIFSFTVCFATDGLGNVANDVRNVVGGVENTVENAARDVSNVSKDVTGSVENGMNSDTHNSMSRTNNYNTTRVATGSSNMSGGMSASAWTWLILGIVAIAIIAVVWYYSMQLTNGRNNHDDNDQFVLTFIAVLDFSCYTIFVYFI